MVATDHVFDYPVLILLLQYTEMVTSVMYKIYVFLQLLSVYDHDVNKTSDLFK